MKSLLNSFHKLYGTTSDLIDKACQPNPKYTPSVFQQQASHKRNKAIFISYIGLFICYTCDLFLTKGPIIHDLMTLFQLVITVVSLVLSCQYHPEIFKCVYNFEVVIYGPIILYVNPRAIFMVLILGQIMPLCVHLITGSYRHFFLQAIIQFVLINTYYQDFIAKMLSYSTSEEILKSLIDSGSLSYIIQFSVLIGMGGYIDMACQQAVNLEMKKNEAEKQKVFLLSFSHELRNLINSLTGNVKLASLENIGFKARDLLLTAEVCGELLLHMINNILDTGKSEIGELEVDMSPTRAYDTFEKIWGICSELIRRKDLRGYMKIPKNLPRVLVMDHHRLTQIFLNLVGNSIKFTNKGSINITVQWLADETCVSEECFKPYPFNHSDEQDEGLFEKQQIFNSLSEELLVLTPIGSKVNQTQLKIPDDSRRGVLKLIVSDTGCGMTQSQVEKLFRKFSQVTLDASKKKLGTGLGLFISKELCNKMGGEIRVYSQKDKGTSFIICLPTEQIKEDERQVINNWEIARAMLAQRRLKVMIVDDALLNHDILKNFFAALDITVSGIALNGLEAVRKYSNYLERGEQLDIVTMDLDMPIMNGKEAAQKIREIEKDKELQPCFLLIISGNCLESEIKECLDQGGRIRADAFLRKPIKIEDLTRIVVSRFGTNQS